jgi:predicted amidohydrolase YtcJ
MTLGPGRSHVVILDAEVITLDPAAPRASAIAMVDGRIVAVGDRVHDWIGPNVELIEGRGLAVLPGFVDSHSHMFFGGVVAEAVDLSTLASVPEIVAALRRQASITPDGHWIRGAAFSLEKLREGRHPTARELDAASDRHPIWITSDSFHSSASNSLGFERIALADDVPGQERDASGQRTGVFLTDHCNIPARRRVFAFISDGEAASMIRRVADDAARCGVTTIHAFEGSRLPSGRDFEVLLRVKDTLPVHIVPFYETFDVAWAKERGAYGVGGCGRCNLDGMPNVHTAALQEAYADAPERKGELHCSDSEIEEFIRQAYMHDVPVGMHAMGDAAVEQLLSTYERLAEGRPQRAGRCRIEHFHLPTADHIARAGRLHLVLAMQPIMSQLWGGPGGVFRTKLGEARVARIDRYRDIVTAGGIATTGADLPIHPHAPFSWLSLLTRNVFDRSQDLSVEEALQLAITNGVIAGGEEHERGSLEVGKIADVIIVDRSPFACPVEEMPDIRVLRTFVSGRTVYERQR